MTEEKGKLIAAALLHNFDEKCRQGIVCDRRRDSVIAAAEELTAVSGDKESNRSIEYGKAIACDPLEPVFNILNGNEGHMFYPPEKIKSEKIPFPTEVKKSFAPDYFEKAVKNILEFTDSMEYDTEHINGLLSLLEEDWSYVPSTAFQTERNDISVFDRIKITAAVASCMCSYLEQKEPDVMELNPSEWNEKEMFLLYSMDFSGIQDFIYTISSQGALKTLRTKSFYLEIMMEHIVDQLLERLELSRANRIYSGGGHCYLLIPNTQKCVDTVEAFHAELKEWMIQNFKNSLFAAYGYAACSADALRNIPEGSYSDVFRNVSNMIAKQKLNRYTADTIIRLNREPHRDYMRECRVCKSIDNLNSDNLCTNCQALADFSKSILNEEFFVVVKSEDGCGLKLPFGCVLKSASEGNIEEFMGESGYVCAYGKNRNYIGSRIATKIWVGDYAVKGSFAEMAEAAEGVERIAVLRADVDNLGQAFVAGFAREKNERYVSLTRTAALSRHLSLFFKFYLNKILERKMRNAAICYSGGDDLFIVGGWNDVIDLSVEVADAFRDYSQNTLSLSAGIGIYGDSYPVSSMASEVAEMETASKNAEGKNSITLFAEDTYHWDQFEHRVMGEKYKALADFFDNNKEQGMNFLYNLLELIQNRSEKINFARAVYLLSRMEPIGGDVSPEAKENYRTFSKNVYQWIQSEEESRQLVTAIIIYVYKKRKRGEN